MYRTVAACAATAAITAAITAGVAIGAHSTKPPAAKYFKTIGLGDTALFTGQDLICVNGARLACSSYASPYHGIGVWFTRAAVTVTRPPNVHVLARFAR